MWGRQVYKLYNTSKLDFHVFYCSNVAAELQNQLPPDESKDLKLVLPPPQFGRGKKHAHRGIPACPPWLTLL
jgi:hypothetical protein